VKYFFDRNWPPSLAAAIRELCRQQDDEVVYLDERFAKTCPDVEWIGALANEGGWSIITRDRLSKSKAEREALQRTGIVTFIFSKQWAHQKMWDQAWALVRWWPAVMDVSRRMQSGAFEIPFKYSGNGKMNPIKM